MKKLDPKAESEIEKGAVLYSKPWKVVKIAPRRIVRNRAVFAFLKLFLIMS